ncbi:MAG TPA: MarR family winged helix-turn-helix transcriptional regulator [Steroidobacteraceae bacterium]|nr:MarR family winged helix-turn-helix transcriptional regulator [Steroidobacteraceae bacterium]
MAAKQTTRKRSVRAQRGAAGPAAGTRAGDNPWVNVGDGRHLHIGDFLTFQLIRLANAAKANVTRQYLADFGLSVPEWRLLAMTIRFEPVRFSELVARSSMDKGQASRTLQALTRRGLIAARDAGTGGKRASDSSAPVILTVTSKGRKLYATALPVAQRNQARLLMLLTREERKQLYIVLSKLHSAIGDRDPLG